MFSTTLQLSQSFYFLEPRLVFEYSPDLYKSNQQEQEERKKMMDELEASDEGRKDEVESVTQDTSDSLTNLKNNISLSDLVNPNNSSVVNPHSVESSVVDRFVSPLDKYRELFDAYNITFDKSTHTLQYDPEEYSVSHTKQGFSVGIENTGEISLSAARDVFVQEGESGLIINVLRKDGTREAFFLEKK